MLTEKQQKDYNFQASMLEADANHRPHLQNQISHLEEKIQENPDDIVSKMLLEYALELLPNSTEWKPSQSDLNEIELAAEESMAFLKLQRKFDKKLRKAGF